MKLIRRDPDRGYLDAMLWVPKKYVNIEGTKNALTFTFSDERSARVICLWKETKDHLLVPREFWETSTLPFPVIDCRPRTFPKADIRSKITLDLRTPEETTQRDAFVALKEARGGILQLACGKGKTIIALELAARLGVPTLIVLDNTQLMQQWREQIDDFLEVPGGIGLIQGEVFDWKKSIVLTTYTTLAARAATMPEEVRKYFGLIIWDEAHHVAAPTFCRSADLFYGRRVGLTATPLREDGWHVVYDMHIGKVVYKNLKQDLKPAVRFVYTGFELDGHNPIVRELTEDKNGDLHLSRLAGYLGRLPNRIAFVLERIKKYQAQGRKILVLSSSVEELANLLAAYNDRADLYSDIPVPTPQDVGEVATPLFLQDRDLKKLQKTLFAQVLAQLKDPTLNPVKRGALEQKRDEINFRLKQHEVAKKINLELERRQRAFIKELLEMPSDAGILIQLVKPADRTAMVKSKKVLFSIAKYGREGMDSPDLDTVLVIQPISSRNTLQQILGRPGRKKAGKQAPLVEFFEDNIGPLIGMCEKLRKHLRSWPHEEDGPYEYEFEGYPRLKKGHRAWTSSLLGPGH